MYILCNQIQQNENTEVPLQLFLIMARPTKTLTFISFLIISARSQMHPKLSSEKDTCTFLFKNAYPR